MRSILFSIILFVQTALGSAIAGEADVVNAKARKTGNDVWRISVTVLHDDEGWDHFANKWDVVDPEGNIIATRVLAHPHENEQPFTRLLGGVKIDPSITEVTIRAHDSVHGYGGKEFLLSLKK